MKKAPICFALLLVMSALLAAQSEKSMPASVKTKSAENVNTETAFVFYRPKRFAGNALTPSVYVNGEQIARLDNGRYFVLKVTAGKYKIESSMKHDPLEIEIATGKTQFFEMIILPGNWRGGGRFIPTDVDDGRAAVKKLKPLDKKWIVSDRVTFIVPGDTKSKD